MAQFVVVHWEEEKSYSTVSLKKVDTCDNDLEKIINYSFRIKWKKGFETGKIVGLGTKMQMVALERDLAEKAANESFAEKREDVQSISISQDTSLPRKRKRHENTSSTVIPHLIFVEQMFQMEDQLQLGETDNQHQADDISSEESSRTQNNALVENVSDNNGVQLINDGPRPSSSREELLEKDNMIATLQSKNSLLKKQLKRLKRCVLYSSKRDSLQENNEKVSIAPGIELDRSLVELTKISYITRPSLFFRKLLFDGGLFNLEEIAASSITGKSSPLTPLVRRPCLDPLRFSALKDFTINTCGLVPKSFEYSEFDKKLKNVPGDARKRVSLLNKP